jgi:hypothetical protein
MKECMMKSKLSRLAVTLALALASGSAAYAHEENSEAMTGHWLSHVAEGKGAPTANQLAPYGYPADRSADREINVSGGGHLNVTRLETARITVGGKSIVWTFDTLGTTSFPLSRILPGADGITVYVAENPMYSGG